MCNSEIQVAVLAMCTEIEDKSGVADNEFKVRLEKLAKDQEAVIAQAEADKKKAKKDFDHHLVMIEQRLQFQINDMKKTATEVQEKRDTNKTNTRAQLQHIQSQVGMATVATVETATPGQVKATLLPVAPGNIVHSNNICPEEMKNTLKNNPALMGLTDEQAAAVTQASLQYVQTKAMTVGTVVNNATQDAAAQFHAAQDAAFAGAAAAIAGAAPAPTIQALQQQSTHQRELTDFDDDAILTDVEVTDSEDEAAAANGKRETPPKKKMKTMTRKDKAGRTIKAKK